MVKKIHSNQWIISKGRTDVTNDVRSFSYNERKNIMKEMKEYKFDIEMIIDHEIVMIMGNPTPIATHHRYRGVDLKDLEKIIRLNMVPKDDNTKITFIIRGVNY